MLKSTSFRIFLYKIKVNVIGINSDLVTNSVILQNIPYGEESHIACTVAKETHNKPRNRFKTTFPCT